MKLFPLPSRIVALFMLCSGLAGAALVVPVTEIPRSAAESDVSLQVAGMLLMDEEFLEGREDSEDSESSTATGGSETTGKVDAEVQVDRLKQDAGGSRGNTQGVALGSATGSRITGRVDSKTKVRSISQAQSGRMNKQAMEVGTVSNSQLTGTVKTRSFMDQGSQSQSGVGNRQNMSLGSVR